MRRSALGLSFLLLASFPAAARAEAGDIIVQREPGASSHEILQQDDVKLVATLPIERTQLVEPADGDVIGALDALRNDDDVVSAEPDTRVQLTAAAPNDFYWTSLWGLSNVNDDDIDAPEAWSRGYLGAGVTVGVVD